MKYILHNYRRCPFCIRVRILLYLKGVEYEVVEEPLRKWTAWMQQWSAQTSERPRIPVLRGVASDGDETIFTESNDINLMLDAVEGDPAYTPEAGSAEYESMEEWFVWCDTIFKQQIDLFKYGKDLVMDDAAHVEHAQELKVMVLKLEDALTVPYLLGETLSLTDIAIISFVRQIQRTRGGEFDFTDFPKVVKWMQSVVATDWFETEVMKKYPLAAVG
ncbi:MAG: glutathione S-transferase [Patiriisocius sp.]|jgi:glutathione S-transferase